MEACGEAPSIPPAGYQYAPCPPLATEEEQRALKGRKILAAHLLDGATGWFMGTVQAFGVGPAWKQPDATHIVVSSVQAGRDQDQGARRARRLQAVGRELRRLGVVAASRAADVTQRVTGLRVVF